ncbi:MAG: DUF2099 family protein [Methanopyri archaeon]|nr:DUF2099 family protein [Methanopyri archaeon]
MTKYSHVMECHGRVPVKVTWKDGEVTVEATGEPSVEECPLMSHKEGYGKLSRKSAENHVLKLIEEIGAFTPRRKVIDCEPYVSFGVSESLSTALQYGLLDAVVLVSDCLGTVVTDKPALVQGLGGRISGIVETDPVPEVVEKVESKGAVVLERIDQEEGLETALEEGFERVAVTVTDPETAVALKEAHDTVFLAAVHVSDVEDHEAETLVDSCDLVTGCPGPAAELAGKRSLLQAGEGIPVHAMTGWGVDVMLARIRELTGFRKVMVR